MADSKKNFWELYSKSCMQNKMYPLRCIMRHFKGTELSLPVEAVRPDHWHHLLLSLSVDNSLTKIHFGSTVSPHKDDPTNGKRNNRDKGFPPPFGRSQKNIRNISICLSALLHTTEALMILKLENLNITCFEAEQLSHGLANTNYLKLLSLSGCKFELGALKTICDGISRSYVTWLDLSSCALNSNDVQHVCNVIKSHGIRRGDQMFPQTLRYNIAIMDELYGINRVSLNCNYLQFDAICVLMEIVKDDLWVKALDLQNCGIDDEGANLLLELAVVNHSLELIDLRLNDIDESLLLSIDQQLSHNNANRTKTFLPSALWGPSEMIRKYAALTKGKISKRPSVYRFRTWKGNKSVNHCFKSSSLHGRSVSLEDVAVQTPLHEAPDKLEDFISNLRCTIHTEKKLKHFYEARCRKLEKELVFLKQYLHNQGDDIYIDQETYFDIKHTFEKLKIFFDVMKKYGLWEYISMLGFDESADVVIKEDDSVKCVKVLKKDTPMCMGNVQENVVEPCCNCRKVDSEHSHVDSEHSHLDAPDILPVDTENCVDKSSIKFLYNKVKVTKTEGPLNEKVAYKLLQEVMNDYNNSLLHQVHNIKSKDEKIKIANEVIEAQDNTKPSTSKLCDSKSPNATSGAHMLAKKLSCGTMPKHLKELIRPGEIYYIVKKELEKRVTEAGIPLASTAESSSQTIPQSKVITEQSQHNPVLSSISELNISHNDYKECPVHHHKENSIHTEREGTLSSFNQQREETLGSVHQHNDPIYKANSVVSHCHHKGSSTHEKDKSGKPCHKETQLKEQHKEIGSKLKEISSRLCETPDEEDFENLSISELIARRKAGKPQPVSAKKVPNKKETAKSSVSLLSNSKINKIMGHATAKDTRSLTKSEQVLPKSKLKHSKSSQINSKVVPANASSDEINSSDSVVTASDKSSSSSSSSDQSCIKTSPHYNESEHQKSYIESVSDASTFKDVESISDIEVASDSWSPSGGERENEFKKKNVPSVKPTKVSSTNTESSALRGVQQSKSNTSDEVAKSGSSSNKRASNKSSDKSTKSNASSQVKTKNANKPVNKNRSKSNASNKSSSVPSLNDITTVSSQSLNTDSIMKQITGSEENSKLEN